MQKRAQQTKEQILNSATELFSGRGLNGVSIDEIAAAAQVNKQRIYAYFGSKDELFEAVLRNVFARVNMVSQETVSQSERRPDKITEIVIEGFLKVHTAQPSLWRILAWANLEGSRFTRALDQVRKAENESLRRIYEKAVADGLLQPVKFEIWIFTLLAVTYFRFSNALTLPHTLGWTPSVKKFSKDLARELNQIFTEHD